MLRISFVEFSIMKSSSHILSNELLLCAGSVNDIGAEN